MKSYIEGMLCELFLILLFYMQVCLTEKVRYIVSPYESDAQIAFLVLNGYADFALTEDSDLLAYGCKKVRFYPLQKN